MNIKIDIMTLEDLDTIKDRLLTDFDDFWNYNILKNEITNPSSCYIIAKNEDDLIVGFAGEQFILDESNITNIVTKKEFRHQGIGSLLLEHLIEISRNKKMKNITLEVNENNTFAITLYKKHNFEITGFRKKYYNGIDNALIMNLEL